VNIDQAYVEADRVMKEMDEQLAKAQRNASASRFLVAMATDMNPDATLDQRIKSTIYTEAMAQVFARIIEARTHMEVASTALEDLDQSSATVT
jgi:coenzyme F420-reducing hydrogenase alpha subunit